MRPITFTKLLLSLAIVAMLSAISTGCASREVPMQPAENANDPACADVIVRLPDTLADLERRTTNAQATGAWGSPVGVELRCGIEPSGPTTGSCVNVDGIDWVIDSSASPIYRFEAYGRSPGLEVFVDNEQASGISVLEGLSDVVSVLKQTRECVALGDTTQLGQIENS